jgi:hypothetical protein
MNKICMLLIVFSLPLYAVDKADKKEILIKKYFINSDSYMIICKGFPKAELSGSARKQSAREAALINAQMLAKEIFNNSVNVFKNGRIDKYREYDDYAVVYYVISKKNLAKRMKK